MSDHISSDLTSDQHAWVQTHGKSGFRPVCHPNNDTNWATVTTKSAVSLIHMDDDGFGTSTQLLVGWKYWAVFYHDPTLDENETKGDMGSINFEPSENALLMHDLCGGF